MPIIVSRQIVSELIMFHVHTFHWKQNSFHCYFWKLPERFHPTEWMRRATTLNTSESLHFISFSFHQHKFPMKIFLVKFLNSEGKWSEWIVCMGSEVEKVEVEEEAQSNWLLHKAESRNIWIIPFRVDDKRGTTDDCVISKSGKL